MPGLFNLTPFCSCLCLGVGRRVSPRQASYFFLLRQKDVTKKKATPEAAPQALRAWGARVCHVRRGGEKTRPAGSNSFRLKSPAANVADPVRPMGPQQHSPSAWVGTALPAGRLPCWDARVPCAPCGSLAVPGCAGALRSLSVGCHNGISNDVCKGSSTTRWRAQLVEPLKADVASHRPDDDRRSSSTSPQTMSPRGCNNVRWAWRSLPQLGPRWPHRAFRSCWGVFEAKTV